MTALVYGFNVDPATVTYDWYIPAALRREAEEAGFEFQMDFTDGVLIGRRKVDEFLDELTLIPLEHNHNWPSLAHRRRVDWGENPATSLGLWQCATGSTRSVVEAAVGWQSG